MVEGRRLRLVSQCDSSHGYQVWEAEQEVLRLAALMRSSPLVLWRLFGASDIQYSGTAVIWEELLMTLLLR